MSQTPIKPEHESPPSTPRWVKVLGIIAIALVLLFVILMLTGIGGPHGPSRHLPSGEPSGYIPTITHGVQEL